MSQFAAYADLTSLAKDLHAANTNIRPAAHNLLQQTAVQVQSTAQALAPRKTGALANSITMVWNDDLTVTIAPTVEYAAYQEYGTAERGEFGGEPYTITPKKPGGVLVFKVGNRVVFAKKVVNPGVPPHPYMRPALLNVLGNLAPQLAETGALVITRGTH